MSKILIGLLLILNFSSAEPNLYILKTVIHSFESKGAGDYMAFNRKTSATGKYQLIPKTAKALCKTCKVDYKIWKTPTNQEVLTNCWFDILVSTLRKNNIKVTIFNVWLLHNQGEPRGLRFLLGKTLDKKALYALKSNMPCMIVKKGKCVEQYPFTGRESYRAIWTLKIRAKMRK